MDHRAPDAGSAHVEERPAGVTAAGGILIALGGLVAGVGGALSVMAILSLNAEALPSWAGLLPNGFGAAAMLLGLGVLAYGVAQAVSGILVLRGGSWAQVAGIVLAALGAMLTVIGLLRGFGEGASGVTTIFLPVAAAYVYAAWALAVNPAWFAQR